MSKIQLKLHEYRYLPYEHRLAALEVERLLGAEPERVNGSFHVETVNGVDNHTLQRLTYFRDILATGKENVTPQQAQLEASVTKHGNPSELRRQHTRYSAHGLHEYRGKFNPQMVRAVANLLRLNTGDRIWDPFCGSGTVLLEARHQGYNALGVDLNPLAVAIANSKLAVTDADANSLRHTTDALAHRIQEKAKRLTKGIPAKKAIKEAVGQNWMERFPNPEYLVSWFPVPVLAQLMVILDSIDELAPHSLREVFRIIASDILREVSWQDPGDLRVRRRRNPASNYPAADIFVSALHSQMNSVLAAREYIPPHQGWQLACHGDSSETASLEKSAQGFLQDGVECVLSSPPYATALPYIDTQRLSIALLGLADAREIRELDSSLVGSREIQTRERRELEEAIEHNETGLAEEVWQLCKVLKRAFDPNTDGFRRRNTPAVVYRYFSGMTRVMTAAEEHLKKGGCLAFIIGPNKTTLGGNKLLIDTPALLSATGTHVGLELCEIHELNAYSRYNAHSRNSIREERLLIMRRP